MSTYIVSPTAEQDKAVKAFLEALEVSFIKDDEELPQRVLEGIKRGREDIKSGSTLLSKCFTM